MMDDEPLSQDIEDETEEVLSGINKPPTGQSFKEAQELSFSGKSPSVHSDFEMLYLLLTKPSWPCMYSQT